MPEYYLRRIEPMRRISASLSIAVLLAVQAAPLAQAQMQPQTQGDVTYVSGGIADDWQQAMEAQKSQYNLHLLFAQEGTGAYFTNVAVQIIDGNGQTVLNAVSQGPFFYSRLQTCRFQSTASHVC